MMAVIMIQRDYPRDVAQGIQIGLVIPLHSNYEQCITSDWDVYIEM